MESRVMVQNYHRPLFLYHKPLTPYYLKYQLARIGNYFCIRVDEGQGKIAHKH